MRDLDHPTAVVHEGPEVSVVIPTRDGWAMLARRALPSALRQEDVRLEVTVVDDGSAEPPPLDVAGDERERGDVLALDRAPPGEALPELLRAGHVIPAVASNVVARAMLLREIGGFDEHPFILEDPDLAIRLVERGRAAVEGPTP